MTNRSDFPRARAMLDPPGPGDGAIATSLLGIFAIGVLVMRAGWKAAKKLAPSD